MKSNNEITVTLPESLVIRLNERVAAGQFADVSDVVQQSLETFVLEDGSPFSMAQSDFDEWLTSEVAPTYEAMRTNPERGRTIEQIRAHLALEHSQFMKAR